MAATNALFLYAALPVEITCGGGQLVQLKITGHRLILYYPAIAKST
jgi:hypothetical protein